MFQMKETLLEIPPSLPPNLTGIREMNAKTDRYQRSHTDLHKKKKKYSGDLVLMTGFIQSQDHFVKKPAGL